MAHSWNIIFEPNINWDAELAQMLAVIEAYKLSTQMLPLPPSLREQIDSINIIRAIRGTTGIEGNTLSEEQIKTVLAASESRPSELRDKEEQEIINARDVLRFIEEHALKNEECIITEDLVRKIHAITMGKIIYENNAPGRYREQGAVAGEYRAPLPGDIVPLMEKFIQFINGQIRKNPVIRAVLAHFYLVSIHPFGDGNGRTSRGIEAYILFNGGYNVAGFYSLANYYYRNRALYIDQLQDARFRYAGNLTEFVRFSISGFSEELRGVQAEILMFVKKIMYKDLLQEDFEVNAVNRRQYALVRFLLDLPDMALRVKDLKSPSHPVATLWRGLSDDTMYRDIRELVRQRLLVKDRKYLRANLEIMDGFRPSFDQS